MDNPKIRPLEAIPIETEEGKMVYLRDPLQVMDKPLIVNPATFFLLCLMNGSADVRDIQVAFLRRFGQLVQSAEIERLVKSLDDSYLLDNERFRARQAEMIAEFRAQTVRKPTSVGICYPADPEELKKFLWGFFEDRPQPKDRRLSGFVVPHIDLRRGGRSFARVYREAAEGPPPQRALILGTCHSGQGLLFNATRKDFETPLGVVETDKDAVESLASACSFDLLLGEYSHKQEHSIELQTVFLKLLFPEIKIVPVLVGSFAEFTEREGGPRGDERVESFVAGARKLLAEPCWVIASADLSHVGRRFGDEAPVSPSLVESEDRALLEHVAAGDADGFHLHDVRTRGRYKVCGVPPIYVLLRILEGKGGRVVSYEQSPERETQSLVTFAGVVFDA